MNIHEGVKFGSLKSLNRTLKALTKKGTLLESINMVDVDGRTALICAIISSSEHRINSSAIVERLLDAGARLKIKNIFIFC